MSLRPYGPNGSFVCHPCANETPERRAETEAAIERALEASGPTVVITDEGIRAFEEGDRLMAGHCPQCGKPWSEHFLVGHPR